MDILVRLLEALTELILYEVSCTHYAKLDIE